MGREIKRVSENWEHPINFNSEFEPLNEEDIPKGEWYQLFENVSEGTPLSPPFEKSEELIEWLVNNKDFWGHTWTKKQAEGILKSGYVPSFGIIGGSVLRAEELAGLEGGEVMKINIFPLIMEGRLCWSNLQGYFLRNYKYPDEGDIFLSQLFENYHNLVGEKIKIIIEKVEDDNND